MKFIQIGNYYINLAHVAFTEPTLGGGLTVHMAVPAPSTPLAHPGSTNHVEIHLSDGEGRLLLSLLL